MSIPVEKLKNLLKLEQTYFKAMLKAIGKRKIPSLDLDKCPPCMQSNYLEKIYNIPSCLICTMAGYHDYNMADRCIILTKMIYEWEVFYQKKQDINEIKEVIKKYMKMVEKDIRYLKVVDFP